MKSVALSRVMSILSRRNLRKLLNVIQEALPCHQQQWLMQIGQWPISKSEGKFDTKYFIFVYTSDKLALNMDKTVLFVCAHLYYISLNFFKHALDMEKTVVFFHCAYIIFSVNF